MTGKCTAQLLADLGITQSLSRPRISNDNRPLAVSPVDGAEVPADGDGARKEGSLN